MQRESLRKGQVVFQEFMIMQLSVILHDEYRMPLGVAPFSQYLRRDGGV